MAGSAAELAAALKANPSNAEPYLALAALALQEGRLAEAQDLLDRSALAYSIGPETGLEQAWLSAELLARKGNLQAALQQGSAVIARYRMTGLYGPGSLGQLYYAPLMFRRPAMALELAPQLVRIEMPDAWGQRVELLAEWAEQSGDAGQAWKLRHDLKALVPDFSGN
jgi:tetratricopeptide (TPR) repeat protein